MGLSERAAWVAPRAVVAGMAAAVLWTSAAHAHVVGPTLPANDLEAMLSLTGSELAAMKPVKTLKGPPLRAVPPADCNERSDPLDGMQGRVTAEAIASPEAADGWSCNATVVARHATPGGFRVWRYVDRAGHTCAFYDTSLVVAGRTSSAPPVVRRQGSRCSTWRTRPSRSRPPC